MDIASIVGIVFGMGMILLGNYFEHGLVSSLIGFPAAIIVFGGTSGAVMLQFPPRTLIGALKGLAPIFLASKPIRSALLASCSV